MISDPRRFQAALDRFDAANRQDPRRETFEGQEYPTELLYAQRMTHWLRRLAPDASEAVQLAARCQHLRRWEIPRQQFPMDRQGYHRWRTTLYGFHAEQAGRILQAIGYDESTIRRVQNLVRKMRLKSDPEMQLLEDVICVVFLESYFSSFSRQHEEEKILTIVRKTWNKMSPRGHEAALGLPLAAADRALIEKALASPG